MGRLPGRNFEDLFPARPGSVKLNGSTEETPDLEVIAPIPFHPRPGVGDVTESDIDVKAFESNCLHRTDDVFELEGDVLAGVQSTTEIDV